MSELRASVVIPALNAEDTIGDMLTALSAQAGIPRHSWEIIVVDNGSTDATREIVGQFERVTLLVERRRGPSAARDTGLRHAQGEIICHVDADAMPTRRWLISLLAPFENPSVVLAGGKSLSLPPKTAAQRYMAKSARIDAVEYINRPIFPFVPSRNMAVRRKAALAIGGWAVECITGEDVDFCHRLLKAYPSKIAYQPEAILFHHDRETDAGLARQAWSYGEGMAHLYARYTEETRWRLRDSIHVVSQVVGRSALAAALKAARMLRLVDTEKAEHAYHHWLWSWAFWRGFYSYRRDGSYQ
jgi:glycosyltransferase involved in cell wall biosynthesis